LNGSLPNECPNVYFCVNQISKMAATVKVLA